MNHEVTADEWIRLLDGSPDFNRIDKFIGETIDPLVSLTEDQIVTRLSSILQLTEILIFRAPYPGALQLVLQYCRPMIVMLLSIARPLSGSAGAEFLTGHYSSNIHSRSHPTWAYGCNVAELLCRILFTCFVYGFRMVEPEEVLSITVQLVPYLPYLIHMAYSSERGLFGPSRVGGGAGLRFVGLLNALLPLVPPVGLVAILSGEDWSIDPPADLSAAPSQFVLSVLRSLPLPPASPSSRSLCDAFTAEFAFATSTYVRRISLELFGCFQPGAPVECGLHSARSLAFLDVASPSYPTRLIGREHLHYAPFAATVPSFSTEPNAVSTLRTLGGMGGWDQAALGGISNIDDASVSLLHRLCVLEPILSTLHALPGGPNGVMLVSIVRCLQSILQWVLLFVVFAAHCALPPSKASFIHLRRVWRKVVTCLSLALPECFHHELNFDIRTVHTLAVSTIQVAICVMFIQSMFDMMDSGSVSRNVKDNQAAEDPVVSKYVVPRRHQTLDDDEFSPEHLDAEYDDPEDSAAIAAFLDAEFAVSSDSRTRRRTSLREVLLTSKPPTSHDHLSDSDGADDHINPSVDSSFVNTLRYVPASLQTFPSEEARSTRGEQFLVLFLYALHQFPYLAFPSWQIDTDVAPRIARPGPDRDRDTGLLELNSTCTMALHNAFHTCLHASMIACAEQCKCGTQRQSAVSHHSQCGAVRANVSAVFHSVYLKLRRATDPSTVRLYSMVVQSNAWLSDQFTAMLSNALTFSHLPPFAPRAPLSDLCTRAYNLARNILPLSRSSPSHNYLNSTVAEATVVTGRPSEAGDQHSTEFFREWDDMHNATLQEAWRHPPSHLPVGPTLTSLAALQADGLHSLGKSPLSELPLTHQQAVRDFLGSATVRKTREHPTHTKNEDGRTFCSGSPISVEETDDCLGYLTGRTDRPLVGSVDIAPCCGSAPLLQPFIHLHGRGLSHVIPYVEVAFRYALAAGDIGAAAKVCHAFSAAITGGTGPHGFPQPHHHRVLAIPFLWAALELRLKPSDDGMSPSLIGQAEHAARDLHHIASLEVLDGELMRHILGTTERIFHRRTIPLSVVPR